MQLSRRLLLYLSSIYLGSFLILEHVKVTSAGHTGLEQVLRTTADGQLSDQQLQAGIPVDETFLDEGLGGVRSSHGCPSVTDGYPWVKFGSPARCYLAGYQGPCPTFMKMFMHPHKQFGYCQCECFNNDPNSGWEYFCKDVEGKVLAFDKNTKLCYHMFTQGPCKQVEWFVMDVSGTEGVCRRRKCPLPDDRRTFYSDITKSCHKQVDKCTPEYPTEQFHQFQYVEDAWYPKCVEGYSSAGYQPDAITPRGAPTLRKYIVNCWENVSSRLLRWVPQLDELDHLELKKVFRFISVNC